MLAVTGTHPPRIGEALTGLTASTLNPIRCSSASWSIG
jgi:hypothetical protein